jgi:DNA polymerase (family 10)
MPAHNLAVGAIFNKMADLLDIEGANVFRIRAYRNAARVISSLTRDVSEMIQSGEDLTDLPGIGKDLAEKIWEIVETGYLAQLEEIEGRIPSELSMLMKLEGLGPKRIKALYQNLGISRLKELKVAARKGKIRKLQGFGKKTEKAILDKLDDLEKNTESRLRLMDAERLASSLVDYLKKSDGIKKVIVAGSFRRRKETVGDLDILATAKKGSNVMSRFADYGDVKKVLSRGKTRSSIILRSGIQVDLRVLPQVSYGAALHYFTGSKIHNISVRKLGVKKKLKINEYGVFSGRKRIAGKTEEEVYRAVDLSYIEPELRENSGELEAARNGCLPKLVTLRDIRGDLHIHTKYTDGHFSIEEMALAAKARGYEYLAITEHSKRVTMVRGLDAKRLLKQIEEIDRLNETINGIILLKGIEVDILKDGSLDLPDDILKELDLTICAIHYHRRLSKTKMTERVIRAMDNPYFNIFAHPTGRLINERDPYKIDLGRIMEAAKERGCFLEINAHPDRLDLSDTYCKMAKEMGLKLAVSTDAHRVTDLDFIRFGLDQARRGWLEAVDVINTRKVKDLRSIFKRK